MRSVIHTVFGEPAEVLSIGEASVPQPGPGEVLIRTILTPIHNHDLWTVRGRYGYKPDLPAIGGSEAVGTVEALGEGVSNVSIGQRVAVAGVHGSWAEFFRAPAASLVPLPEAIGNEAAAQLIAMPFSAISLLEFLEVQSGDWIVQNAANGAVGRMVAMLGAARGIHVINLVRRDAGVAELAALGIGNAISTAQQDWQDQVKAMTGGAPIRAAVDSVGGRMSGDLLALLAENGLLVSFGTMTGEPMQISSGDLIFKQAVVKGFWGSKVSAAMTPETKRRLFGELLRLAASGELTLPVEAVFGFEAITDAVNASLAPGKTGKVLLKP